MHGTFRFKPFVASDPGQESRGLSGSATYCRGESRTDASCRQTRTERFIGREHSDANTSGLLESEFMFATQRWMKLDIERVVTKGTYGPAQDASAWMREQIDLSKVDEVGF